MFSVLDAPSNLGLRPPALGHVPGCYLLPAALRAKHLVERLGARDAGGLVPPTYKPDWEPGQGVRNAQGIAKFSRDLAERVAPLLDGGSIPLVLGGDCSIILGLMLALRRRGRFGLVHIDGHLDFRHLGNAPAVGAAAGEDLALVTGRGADLLADPDGLAPLVRDDDVVHIGSKEGPIEEEAADILDTRITIFSAEDVRRLGPRAVADGAVAKLDGVAGFWIHVDVDVLDSHLMPAVDSPGPGGMTFEEFSEVLSVLFSSEKPRAVGFDVAIFDPTLDPDGTLAGRLTDALVEGLTA